MPITNQRIFQTQHHNAIAKDIRTEYDYCARWDSDFRHSQRRALESLALRFADRFEIDNSDFDPVAWLNQCSPDVNRFPLGELWHD